MQKTPTLPVLLIAALMMIFPLLGQTVGAISGLVTDSSGSVIVGATVSVTNPETNFTRSTITNAAGNYNLPGLLPGVYNIKAEMTGFQSEVRNSIELQVQQTARIDFSLIVGSVTQTVDVSAGAALLDTENATVGTVIDEKRIEDLPLNGRSFLSLISLSSNVITGQTDNAGYGASRGDPARGSVSLSIAGMRREFTYYSLDGISNTSLDWSTYALLPSIDALQEFKVETGVYSAEFGRQAAQVNISTKSGTNAYHGTLFEFVRNDDFDARPYAFTSNAPGSSPFKWNQFGFTLGGPVEIPKLFSARNRLFFMSNYEGFRLREEQNNVYSVPSAAMRSGDFSQILPKTVIRDPLNNNAPFAGNIIPPNRLNPIAVALLQYYPAPNVAGAGLANNYLELDRDTTNKDQFTQRMDFVESAKSTWFGRYSWQDESSVTPALDVSGTSVATNVKQAMISNTRIFSPTLVNEFRTGWLGYSGQVLPALAFKQNVDGQLNIPLDLAPLAPADWGTPNIAVTGFSSFGSDRNTPYSSFEDTFQWADGLTWTHGSHAIKMGAEVRRDREDDAGGQQVRGQYTFQNQATGYGFSDYMLGYPEATSTAGVQSSAQLRATSQAYYITDDWKILKNLTMEVGLRYEYTPPWGDKGDSLLNFIIPTAFLDNPFTRSAQLPYFGRDCAAYGQSSFYPPETIVRYNPALQVQCVNGPGNTLINPDKTNFAPRLGIAWSPKPKWTLRIGLGIFYTQDEINSSYYDLSRNLAGSLTNSANLATHDLTFENPFSVGTNSNACGVPSPPFVCVSRPGTFSTDPNLRTPYIYQYEMNIQRQLTNSTVLEIGYLGSSGNDLMRLLVYNDAYPSTLGTPVSRTAFPEYSFMQMTRGVSKSNYNSGTIKLTQRLSHGLSALVAYTFSKSLDDGSASRPGNSETTQPQNSACVLCEYSLSDFDARNRFVASVLYEAPFGKGKQFLNHGVLSSLLGGWQLNAIITKSSGFPLELLDGVNQTNTELNVNRPDAVPGVSEQLSNPTTGEWFNIESVQLQPFGSHYGTVGRNTIIGPGIFDADLSLLKNFSFTERVYLQFRFECFNCTNHPNFGDPNTTLTSNMTNANGMAVPGTGAFGTITSTRVGIDMRELQLSLKLIF